MKNYDIENDNRFFDDNTKMINDNEIDYDVSGENEIIIDDNVDKTMDLSVVDTQIDIVKPKNIQNTPGGELVKTGSDNLSGYISQINKFPILTKEEEYKLAKQWIEKKDINSANQLINSHLRLVLKIALNYRGYGLPLVDLVSEGNVGMIKAVKGFNPDMGSRLSTYATYWIKASIHEYILKTYSMVKIGTTAAQKKLFFSLRDLKKKKNINDRSISDVDAKQIANELGVKDSEVKSMDARIGFGNDYSLNMPIKSDDGNEKEWIETIKSNDEKPFDEQIIEEKELKRKKEIFNKAFEVLNDREKEIFTLRNLQEKPETLESLAEKFKVSKERIRQIDQKSYEKVRNKIAELTYND